MAGAARGRAQRRELEAVHEVADAKLLVQRQEVEIQQLRMSLSAFQLQAQSDEAASGERIAALAQLDIIRWAEVVHFLGPPGTGKSHLATALGVAL